MVKENGFIYSLTMLGVDRERKSFFPTTSVTVHSFRSHRQTMHTFKCEADIQAFTGGGALALNCLISLLQRQGFIQASTEENGVSHNLPPTLEE